MATRSQKVKLGAFVLVALAVAVVMLVTMTELVLLGEKDRYFVRVPGASGLSVGSKVTVLGVDVGKVEEIALHAEDYESVTITLAVEPGTRINADAKAFIEFEGVTGRKNVDIHDGSADSGALAPGSYIPHGRTIIEELPDRAEQLLARTTLLLDAVNDLVGSLAASVAQVDVGRVNEILADTEDLAETLTVTTRDLNKLVRELRGPLTRSIESAADTFERIDELAERTNQTAASLDQTIAQLSRFVQHNDDDVNATLRHLRRASESVEVLARELRNQPGLLLFGEAPKERELP